MTFARPLALSLALLAYIIPRSKWTRRGGRLFIPHRARAAAVSSGIASKKRGTGRGGRGGREGVRARRTASQSPSSFPASLPRYSLTSIVRQKQPSPRRSSVILSICEADWITPITKSSLRFIKAAHCPTLLASLSRQRAPLAGGLPRSPRSYPCPLFMKTD